MHRSTEHVRLAGRSLYKELVWTLLCTHRQGPRPNICLFANRRGGSTWVMEMIAANKGVRPLDQPLELQARNVSIGQFVEIPKYAQGQITSAEGVDGERLERAVGRVLDGSYLFNAPVRFWESGFEFVSDRLVLKILDAKAVIDWFDTTFDIDVVYLTRHPIPQALSCIRNNWTLTVEPYLRDEWFVERYLGADRVQWCREVLSDGSELDRFVLNWGLENLAPITLLPDRPRWVHVSYEQCIAYPETVARELATRLGLADLDKMLERVGRPSKSSSRSTAETRAGIEAGRAADTASSWRAAVTRAEEVRMLGILTSLGIDLSTIGIAAES